jgi:hypothetical protein
LAAACLLTIGSALADPSQLKLRDDFAGDDFAPGGGLFYKDNAEQRAGRFRMKSGGVRSASAGLELSVVPQCRPEQRGCSERAEVWEKPEVLAGYGATLWYAFSMKLDDPPPAASHRYVVAQWKRGIKPDAKGDYSPFLAIRIIRGQLALTIDSDAMPSRMRGGGDAPLACASDAAPAQQRGEARQTRILVTASPGARPEQFGGYDSCAPDVKVIRRGGVMPKADSNWIDFVFKVRPGPQGDGEIEAFANGAWIATVRGRIGHEGPELRDNQYFKFGPYRDGGQTDTWRVFYDAFRRGPACKDVAEAVICRQLDGS